jgi:membrane associated rhomboid family serine protease
MGFKVRNIVMPLVGLNVLFFILQIALGRNFTESLMLISSDVFVRPWILLTSMFLHGDPFHLLFNMYVLFMFGTLLEHRLGAKKFFILYISAGIVAAFLSSFFYPAALGASGAIYGILGAIIILIPNLRVLFLFAIPMSLLRAIIIITIIDLLFFSNIAVAAHIAGLCCGVSYGLYLKKQKTGYDRRFYSKTHMDSEDIEEYFKTGRI